MSGARQKRKHTSNRVLVVLGLFLLAFIVTMTVTYWVKGGVPDTLIQYTLGAGGVEALVLAGIKISKVLKGESPVTAGGGDTPLFKVGFATENLSEEKEDTDDSN